VIGPDAGRDVGRQVAAREAGGTCGRLRLLSSGTARRWPLVAGMLAAGNGKGGRT